jgi:hypothetical protein
MHAPAASLLYQRVVAVVSTFSCHRLSPGQPWPWISFLLPLCTSARNIPSRRRQHGVRRGVRPCAGQRRVLRLGGRGHAADAHAAGAGRRQRRGVAAVRVVPPVLRAVGRVVGQQDRCGTVPQQRRRCIALQQRRPASSHLARAASPSHTPAAATTSSPAPSLSTAANSSTLSRSRCSFASTSSC